MGVPYREMNWADAASMQYSQSAKFSKEADLTGPLSISLI